MSSGNLASVPEPRVRGELTRLEDPSQSISVCHVISGDLWAGAEAQVAALLKYLSQSERLTLSAVVLNEGRLTRELRNCDVEVRVIPEREHSFLSIVQAASHFVRSRKVRILHSHRYKENLIAGLLSWWCGVPHVVRTVHGGSEPFQGLRNW